MGMLLAQELEAVRREVDDQQPPAGRERRAASRRARAGSSRKWRTWWTARRVEAAALHRQRVDVALPQLDAAHARPLDRLARATASMAWLVSTPTDAARARRQQGEHAAGAGAEVEQRPIDLFGPRMSRIARLHLGRPTHEASGCDPTPRHGGRSRPAPPRPARCGRPRAGPGRRPARRSLLVETLARGSRASDAGRSALGDAEEGPGALAMALDQAGLGHELEMPRDARLRLAEDVGEVGDVELALGRAAPARAGASPPRPPGGRRRGSSRDTPSAGGGHGRNPGSAKFDIKISLCRQSDLASPSPSPSGAGKRSVAGRPRPPPGPLPPSRPRPTRTTRSRDGDDPCPHVALDRCEAAIPKVTKVCSNWTCETRATPPRRARRSRRRSRDTGSSGRDRAKASQATAVTAAASAGADAQASGMRDRQRDDDGPGDHLPARHAAATGRRRSRSRARRWRSAPTSSMSPGWIRPPPSRRENTTMIADPITAPARTAGDGRSRSSSAPSTAVASGMMPDDHRCHARPGLLHREAAEDGKAAHEKQRGERDARHRRDRRRPPPQGGEHGDRDRPARRHGPP